MPNKKRSYQMTTTALLCAIAILIPLVNPFKIIIGPASYTLGSHIPINMAMMMSTGTGISVSLIAAIGFLFAGFPMPVVWRAFTHCLYVAVGSWLLRRKPHLLAETRSRILFNFLINILHALGEVLAVFTYTSLLGELGANWFYTLWVLVGLGTVIHGMIDFELSYQLTKVIQQRLKFKITPLTL